MSTTDFNPATIEAEYRRLGYQRGWGFMATPERSLHEARVVIVGLNPGGGGADDHYRYEGLWDSPAGNGYFLQKWGKNDTWMPVQSQVQAWHSALNLKPDDTLCAQFVPFRSPDWNRLEHKGEALAFAQALWTWVLETSPAKVFITMGKLPAMYLANLLNARPVATLPSGWGSQTIGVWDSPSGRRIVGMPHPSRYTLFERANGASSVAEASLRLAAMVGDDIAESDVQARPTQ